MAIIFGGNPQTEERPRVAAPESEIKRDAAPAEDRGASVEASEETKAEVEPRPAVEGKKSAKRERRNGKKAQ